MSRKEKEEENDATENIAKAVGAVAGVAAAAWGMYKFFTGTESSSNSVSHQTHEPRLAYSLESKSIARRELPSANWSLPQKGWVKINTDASLRITSVAIGGVIRNDDGVWKSGFARRIPSCTIPQAELWAIKEGLMIAWNCGFKKIEIETDSEAAIRLYNQTNLLNVQELDEKLIQDCRNLMKRNWSVTLKHCFREANRVADYMANLGHGLDLNTMNYYDEPPMGVVPRLNRDL